LAAIVYFQRFTLISNRRCVDWKCGSSIVAVRMGLVFAAPARHSFEQKENPTKLRARDIAHMVKAILEIGDRGFTPEPSILRTNSRN
jgi:hypothetical protein